MIRRQEETIKIEVGLREPLLTPMVKGQARTILLDPVSGKPLVPPVSVNCISRFEALAEKFRAALSLREAAIGTYLTSTTQYGSSLSIRRSLLLSG